MVGIRRTVYKKNKMSKNDCGSTVFHGRSLVNYFKWRFDFSGSTFQGCASFTARFSQFHPVSIELLFGVRAGFFMARSQVFPSPAGFVLKLGPISVTCS